MTSPLRLQAVERSAEAFADAVGGAIGNTPARLAVLPDDGFAAAIHDRMPGAIATGPSDADVLCLTHDTVDALEAALLAELDRRSGLVVIPRLAGHGLDRPIFLISIPKAGTHLLYRLAPALGFKPGIICPDDPSPGHWYCIEYSNSHTVPRDFFVDSLRRAPFGNRAHPFMRSPALFIFRHPLDILIAEADYYAAPANSPLAPWYAELDLDQRIERLLEDDRLIGRFADRIRAFSPWLAFPNVVPVPFEDVVGAAGGGDEALQHALIWSIQLRLGVPGTVQQIASQLFDPASPTFREGKIGGHRQKFAGDRWRNLESEAGAAMAAFGYACGGLRPRDAELWRRRPVRPAAIDFDDTPILIQQDFLGYNLIRFRRRYYGVPAGLGEVDIASLGAAELAALPNADRTDALQQTIALAPVLARLAAIERWRRPWWALALSFMRRVRRAGR